MSVRREFGVIGLGKMGAGIAAQALGRKMKVAGNDLAGPPKELVEAGVVVIDDLGDFRRALEPPRAVFVYVPAGPTVDRLLDDLCGELEAGDVIVDAGNSYWRDSIRRREGVAERGLELVDLGTSGGVSGAREGACFMAGGERRAVERVESLLIELAVEGGYVHAGPPGAGHFTKLVHNGIEFGMLQAIAEGTDLLEHYRDELPVADVLSCWRHGSVIRSWLIDLLEQVTGSARVWRRSRRTSRTRARSTGSSTTRCGWRCRRRRSRSR